MDTQQTNVIPGLAYCSCCAPRQLLIPRDDLGAPGQWGVCLGTGAWYAADGLGQMRPAAGPPPVQALVPAPAQGIAPARANAWAGGDGLPSIVPGVRIDLSKESYA
jgi:hypothetical protein